MLPLVMDATEGLETAVLADVTAVTAETLLVESDCITGEEQETVRTIKEKKKKQALPNNHTQNQQNICNVNFRDEPPCYVFFYL